jgi:hypothetical protein
MQPMRCRRRWHLPAAEAHPIAQVGHVHEEQAHLELVPGRLVELWRGPIGVVKCEVHLRGNAYVQARLMRQPAHWAGRSPRDARIY